MDKLINLRHLENYYTVKVECLPQGIGRLGCLWTLNEFIVGDGKEECKIEDLRHLVNIRGNLGIIGLGKVKTAMEAEAAEMKNKIHIHDLTLKFDGKGTKGVAEALQPHPNLQSLSIAGYGTIEWPNWMMGSCLTQLKNLILSDCRNCSNMPPLGELPLLETLHICCMDGVKCLGGEFLGSSSTISFPKLKKLRFNDMKGWKKWEMKEEEERSVMPCLCHLRILNCQKLEGLPDHVLRTETPLQELIITIARILEKRYRKDNGEDWHKVSHVSVVSIHKSLREYSIK